MGITIKNAKEIEHLREGGKRLGRILGEVAKVAKAGTNAKDLNVLAERLTRASGDAPSFLNYQPKGAKRAFPASLCVSVNDAVVHGIPDPDLILQEGDVVSLDMGLVHEGMYLDAAITIGVGEVDARARKLIRATEDALAAGIKAARAGQHTGDIGAAIERVVARDGYGLVRDFAGHGVGYSVHEEPLVPNFGKPRTGTLLKPGMVLAIEPMITEGDGAVHVDADGFTVRTRDGSRSAHVEHTVLITDGAPEILTLLA